MLGFPEDGDRGLAFGYVLAPDAPQDVILSVLRLSVATQPNAPWRDVNVAQVKADMARSVPEAVVQHHLLALQW